MTALLRLHHAGPHVTVQDAGRPGLMRYGVPTSGPMDRLAHAAANTALGRPAGAAAIEVSPGGLTLDCADAAVTVAVAGGGFVVKTGDYVGGAWRVITLQPGARLIIRPGLWGSWTYLAVAGDLEVPVWLGSRATHALSGLGGGVLRTGDEIAVSDPQVLTGREGPFPCPLSARARRRIRMAMGPQEALFTPDARVALTAAPFRLTPAFDRMGVRLDGPSLTAEGALSIPSEPITRGAIQVAGDGVPVVLLADHQTTGGYPKIATVLSHDTDRLAQLRPGDTLRFVAVTPAEAVSITRETAHRHATYLHALTRRPG